MRGGVVACGVPRSLPVVVLKFGSSVLSQPEGYRRAADEVRKGVACRKRVVAVVSAMGSTTDRLLEAARSLAPTTALALLSQLLATGEEASVALLCIALTSTAVNAVSLPTEQFGLRTHGALSDANPVAADTSTLAAALATHDVVVLPGFVGRDASGAPSLLGRGGSDLTALFLGDALDASEVRLVKDVDGGVLGRSEVRRRRACAHPRDLGRSAAHRRRCSAGEGDLVRGPTGPRLSCVVRGRAGNLGRSNRWTISVKQWLPALRLGALTSYGAGSCN